jgi:phosphomannomutase
MKNLIIFDLDGTLAESKSSLHAEMAAMFSALLSVVKSANLPHDEHLNNLSLLPNQRNF